MSTIKKSFVELYNLLEQNKHKKIETILPEILELVTSKKTETTLRKDQDGNITHILCWYHKKWEPVELFGKKQSSNSGLNTMCKEGVNQWTRQQALSKKEQQELLIKVANQEIPATELNPLLSQIEERRNVIVPRSDEVGYDSLDELEEALS